MQCAVTCLCRGDGRSYLELRLSGVPAGATLRLSATWDGTPVPCKLIRRLEHDRQLDVAVLPLFETGTVALALDAVSPEGQKLASWSWSSTAASIKWTSRLNYRLHPRECALIRGVDEAVPMPDEGALRLRSLLFNEEAGRRELVLRFQLTVPAPVPADGVEMAVLGPDMRPVTGDRLIPMGEAPANLLRPDSSVRRLLFSVAVANGDGVGKTYVFTAPGLAYPCFLTLTPALFQGLLGDFAKLSQNASWNPIYKDWLEWHRASEADLRDQRHIRFSYAPLISLIVPLYKTPVALFHKMAQSVRDQTYGKWELLLVNASPEDAALAKAVALEAREDPRIKVLDVSENRGITLNTRVGIEAAQGDFVAFLDHDDALFPEALFEYVRALNEDPDLDVLYCDEDMLQPNGVGGFKHANPHFKPEFSKYYLLGGNYITHLLMIRKSLLDQLEYNDPTLDGAQDFGMLLEAVEHTDRVKHIPRILYSWRVLPTSTAAGVGAKPYAITAGRLALEQHLVRLGIEGEVVEIPENPCRYNIHYAVKGDPTVDIIIPSKDQPEVLGTCVRSILEKTTYERYRIVIVENGSSEESVRAYQELCDLDPRVTMVHYEPEGGFNYSAINNYGVRQCTGQYLLFLNNDTEVITPDWLQLMLGIGQDPEVGAVGVRLVYPDGALQHGGVLVTEGTVGHYNDGLLADSRGYQNSVTTTREVSAVTGACLLTRRDVFEQLGGFDESFPVAYNDVDYCLKLRAEGLLVVYDAEVKLTHHESLSRGYENTDEKKERLFLERLRLMEKWPKHFMKGDPYLNKNLRQDSPFFDL